MAGRIRRLPNRMTTMGGLPSFPFLPLHREDHSEESRYPVVLRGRRWGGKMFQLVARPTPILSERSGEYLYTLSVIITIWRSHFKPTKTIRPSTCSHGRSVQPSVPSWTRVLTPRQRAVSRWKEQTFVLSLVTRDKDGVIPQFSYGGLVNSYVKVYDWSFSSQSMCCSARQHYSKFRLPLYHDLASRTPGKIVEKFKIFADVGTMISSKRKFSHCRVSSTMVQNKYGGQLLGRVGLRPYNQCAIMLMSTPRDSLLRCDAGSLLRGNQCPVILNHSC
ncbi:hypothetical protein EDD85DRAFT_942248 [Armillaria nabsnona]|nr:hypothetical protein EDD85DRAFT_942248 [Armillaria nabsnona]